MKIVEQGHVILYPCCSGDWRQEGKLIELAGRTAYKSEDNITDDSYKAFIRMIAEREHEAVLEFGNMVVRFITDRGITHELVRHRLCSFVQESTRYCNYGKDKFGNELTFICPRGTADGSTYNIDWHGACLTAEERYLSMLERGYKPQIARSVLPNSLKTEIVVKANFREWRHIFQLRAIEKAAHPDMRKLMIPLYRHIRNLCPVIFDLGEPE